MSRLEIRKLTKLYGTHPAVQSFDLDVAEREFVSLLGPSGCGKTTTLRCVAGLEIPTSGRISLGDREVTRLPPEHRNVGMVFQNYALFPHMTVAENIGFGLKMRGVRGAEARRRVDAAIDMVHLGGLQDRHPRQLSGGQQQRVALARALMGEPALLLLDEPLANLDAKLRDEMRVFIRSIQQQIGISALYVTHDQAEAMTMSDRIVVMFGGSIQQIGSPRDIYYRPATREVANFVGQSNCIAGKVVARQDARVLVETAVGVVRCEGRADVALGATGQVMLRPETIRLARAGGELAGRVTQQHFLGNVIDTRVALADGTIISVQTIGEEAHGVGDDVSVVIDESRAWLMP